MTMYSSFSLQNVTNISARAHADLESAPVLITFEGEDWQQGHAEVCIHTENAELALALVEAINGAVAAVRAKQSMPQAA